MARSRTSEALVPSPPRVVIEDVEPEIDAGRFPIKRVAREPVRVRAAVFTEGHDHLSAVLLHRPLPEGAWVEVPMEALGNDRFEASFTVAGPGSCEYTIEAWIDTFGSWRDGLAKKVAAGQDVSSELLEGAALVREASARAGSGDRTWLAARAERLEGDGDPEARVELALSEGLLAAMARNPDRSRATRLGRSLPVQVERERARSGAWYEFFPRSASPVPDRHGTLRDCEARLEDAAALGFDVVYLPPVHPIGRTHRKGPNNTPEAGPDDPGSPWAIGAEEGGHTAIHPELGTLEDFDRLVARADALGLEIALDLAFQCSPDHPWVRKHPEWFRHRPDGTIQYAENPPKKYQDIYPLYFECEDWRALWNELLGVVRFWIGHGVRIFRVDNPHTKPFAFWEWLIQQVRADHPDVVFLAEAFTRPSVLQYLAKLGFSQSYGYFTWRNTKAELTEYFTTLGQAPLRDFLRSNLFPNTPDILHEVLQTGSRAVFQARLVLAATLAGNYGIYGPPFELCVGDAIPGTEEYRDSEKYQLRHWDPRRPGHIRETIARVNEIRRACPALTRGGPPVFYPVDNERIIAFGRRCEDPVEVVVTVVNLDPHHVQQGWIELPLEALDMEEGQVYQAHDLLGDARYLWQGRRNFVSLDPNAMPAHVFRLRRRIRTERDFDYYL